ncbi:hypothetical protein L9F63_004922, partial [Diploptera punctata]
GLCNSPVSQHIRTPLALVPLLHCGNLLMKTLTVLIRESPKIFRKKRMLKSILKHVLRGFETDRDFCLAIVSDRRLVSKKYFLQFDNNENIFLKLVLDIHCSKLHKKLLDDFTYKIRFQLRQVLLYIKYEVRKYDVIIGKGILQITTIEQNKTNHCSRAVWRVDFCGLANWNMTWMKGQKFVCPECSREFVNKNNLSVHIRDAHGDDRGPFTCPYCNKLSKNRSSLRNHLYYSHNYRAKEHKFSTL